MQIAEHIQSCMERGRLTLRLTWMGPSVGALLSMEISSKFFSSSSSAFWLITFFEYTNCLSSGFCAATIFFFLLASQVIIDLIRKMYPRENRNLLIENQYLQERDLFAVFQLSQITLFLGRQGPMGGFRGDTGGGAGPVGRPGIPVSIQRI